METSLSKPSTKARRLRHLLVVALGQEEIGARIRKARKEMGLTQQEFAERIGLKNGANVSRLERGIDELTSKRLRRLIDATKKPAEFFVRDPEESQDGRAGPSTAETRTLLRELREDVAGLAQAVATVSVVQSTMLDELDAFRQEFAASQRTKPQRGEG